MLKKITEITTKDRIQLLRIFRKYISPDTSVEMLKRKNKIPEIIKDFGYKFRPIEQVRELIYGADALDVTLAVLLYEYKDRGQKGYDLTELFFDWFETTYGEKYKIIGPVRTGKDIILSNILPELISMNTISSLRGKKVAE